MIGKSAGPIRVLLHSTSCLLGVRVFSTYVDDVYQYRSNVLDEFSGAYDRGIRPLNVTEVSVSFSLLSIKELVRYIK